MLTSLKQLLSSIVDYAGLFPPAQLSLPEAMIVYDRAQVSPHHWMLDRFVLPATRLQEFIEILPTVFQPSSPTPCPLSVIVSKTWQAELELVNQIHTEAGSTHGFPITISSLEIAPLVPSEIQTLCLSLPAGIDAFFEIPFHVDIDPYLDTLQNTNTAAKFRTGGMVEAAFPTVTQLSQRILSLADARIPFKATAGLHHPLRGHHCLTDEPNSPSINMHGFLNVAILAALASRQQLSLTEAEAVLEESTITAFQMTETEIRWRDRSLTIADIERSRKTFFRSFGSCSFHDPINDLLSLHVLDATLNTARTITNQELDHLQGNVLKT